MVANHILALISQINIVACIKDKNSFFNASQSSRAFIFNLLLLNILLNGIIIGKLKIVHKDLKTFAMAA